MSPQVTAAIIAVSGVVLTVIATVVVQYLSRRATKGDLEKQRGYLNETLKEQRTQSLNERFATAADQLGSDKPPEVRLAGVYAMAGLADDWKKNRQTCIDVLCGYLRMPYEPEPGAEAPAKKRLAFEASREVRDTVIRVVTAHLKDGVEPSWQGLDFDFRGVVFDGGDFSGAEFSGGTVNFAGADFSRGMVSFDRARFSGATVVFDAEFSGSVYFGDAEFSDGLVNFAVAEFSGGTVIFDRAKFSGGTVDFSGARFSGGTVHFSDAEFSGGTADFHSAMFSDGLVIFDRVKFSGGTVDLDSAKFSGGRVSFGSAEFSRGTVDFRGAKFSRGGVYFQYARFSGAAVYFRAKWPGDPNPSSFTPAWLSDGGILPDAEFSGGEVDFSRASDWSSPPEFPWTDTPPLGVKLPEQEGQSEA
jgi:uncharacterized protein YjbI with pentapeptide repeats